MSNQNQHDRRTTAAKVRGYGSAHNGTGHHVIQRLTAVALIPIIIYILGLAIALAGQDMVGAQSLLSKPWNALAVMLLLIGGFWHAVLGLQMVIEDYIHQHLRRLVFLWLVRMVGFGLAVAGIFAVLQLAL